MLIFSFFIFLSLKGNHKAILLGVGVLERRGGGRLALTDFEI